MILVRNSLTLGRIRTRVVPLGVLGLSFRLRTTSRLILVRNSLTLGLIRPGVVPLVVLRPQLSSAIDFTVELFLIRVPILASGLSVAILEIIRRKRMRRHPTWPTGYDVIQDGRPDVPLRILSPFHFYSTDMSLACNYRPVSFTCVTCKLLEHIVRSNIIAHLDEHKLLSDRQPSSEAQGSRAPTTPLEPKVLCEPWVI